MLPGKQDKSPIRHYDPAHSSGSVACIFKWVVSDVKHVALGMGIRHLIRSEYLLVLLNHLGHLIGYDQTEKN